MMARLEARGRRLAAQAQADAIARLAVRAGEELAGTTVTQQDNGVTLTGPGLGRRLLDEPMLRWIGSLMR